MREQQKWPVVLGAAPREDVFGHAPRQAGRVERGRGSGVLRSQAFNTVLAPDDASTLLRKLSAHLEFVIGRLVLATSDEEIVVVLEPVFDLLRRRRPRLNWIPDDVLVALAEAFSAYPSLDSVVLRDRICVAQRHLFRHLKVANGSAEDPASTPRSESTSRALGDQSGWSPS